MTVIKSNTFHGSLKKFCARVNKSNDTRLLDGYTIVRNHKSIYKLFKQFALNGVEKGSGNWLWKWIWIDTLDYVTKSTRAVTKRPYRNSMLTWTSSTADDHTKEPNE